MKSQINLVNQLQELVFTRDERNLAGDYDHLDALNASIDALSAKLDPRMRELYLRLYKKDHVVMAPVSNDSCSICGMHLPIAQVQQVRLAKTIQTCSNCGRMLCWSDQDAPHSVPLTREQARAAARKTGIARFSAEELICFDLPSDSPEAAIGALAERMEANGFVKGAPGLVAAAMERESMLSTFVGKGVAFPHVRGVEGGALTLALGLSREGVTWDDSGAKAHLVFFSTIPLAVSAFYLRLMAGLAECYADAGNRGQLLDCATEGEAWKLLTKHTRRVVR